MSHISSNIKLLRKRKGLTQEKLASILGMKRSLIGAYEEGRAEPNIDNLMRFAEALEINLEELLKQDLRKELTANATDGDTSVKILSITVDRNDEEYINLVPQKAAAGYLSGYADPGYVADLPVFAIPGFKNGTFRAFEISGDSMLPLVSGTIIVARYVDNWIALKAGTPCIVLSQSEGVVFKRTTRLTNGAFELVSDNKLYSPFEINVEDILEIWEAKGYFTTQFPDATND